MPQFTQSQLDQFWNRYVFMKEVDVISVSLAEPEFAAMLGYVYTNKLYGFGNSRPPGGYCLGGAGPFNGPIKS